MFLKMLFIINKVNVKVPERRAGFKLSTLAKIKQNENY
jgi:hypothetical protein